MRNKLSAMLLALLCCQGLNAQIKLRHLMESSGSLNFLDFNQDQAPDMAMSNAESFSIALGKYDSTGHLQFTAIPNQAFINTVYFTQIRAADWDNDGDVDLIPEIHYVYEYHSVLTENKNGIFADTAVRFSNPFPELMTTLFHDFNQDGFTDAFFSKNGKTYIRNGATTELLLLPVLPNGAVGTAGLSLIDLNRDGWMDVLRSKTTNNITEVLLFQGKSNFEFEAERLLYNAKGSPITNAGDFDGDGTGDFLTIAPYPVQDTVIIRSKLLSANPIITALRIPKNSKMFYPDINQDGMTDIVYALSDTFHLRLNLGNGQFEAHHFLMKTPTANPTATHPYPVGIGQDFFANTFALIIRYNFHFLNGVFSVSAAENTFTNGLANDDNYANACLGDIDGDGNRELVLGMWNNRGIATASLHDSTTVSRIIYSDFHGEEVTALESADFDLDGRDELVFFDRAGALQIGGTDSSGNFVVAAPLLTDDELRNTFEVKTADFDGNGYPDILFGDDHEGGIVLLANQNGSDFTRHVVIPNFTLRDAKVTDFNNDGLPDVLIQPKNIPNTSNAAFIFKNEGNLQFTKTTYSPSGVWGKSPSEGPLKNTIVLRNANELTLAEITPDGFQNLGSVDVVSNEYAVLDYNRDSLPDIYYSKATGKTAYICLNKGDGTFEKDAVLLPFMELNNVFDLEKDGVPEFLAISRRDWVWGKSVKNAPVSKIHETTMSNDLVLWPSPASASLNIQQSADAPILSVDIYALSGRLCKRIQCGAGNAEIPLGGLEQGAYILVARYSGGQERLGRFVKGE